MKRIEKFELVGNVLVGVGGPDLSPESTALVHDLNRLGYRMRFERDDHGVVRISKVWKCRSLFALKNAMRVSKEPRDE